MARNNILFLPINQTHFNLSGLFMRAIIMAIMYNSFLLFLSYEKVFHVQTNTTKKRKQ